MKKNSLISILISLMVVVSACSSTPESNAGNDNNSQKGNSVSYKKDTIVVGVENANAPFSYIDENGSVTGFDADLIKAIAEDQGLKVDFKPMNFGSIVPSLQTEQIDAAISSTSLAITSERSEQVDFSEEIMMYDGSLASKKGSNIKDVTDIKKGDVLAVKTGSVAETIAELFAEDLGAIVRRFDTTDKVLQDVINGQSDVALESTFIFYEVLWKDRNYGIQILDQTSDYFWDLTNEAFQDGGKEVNGAISGVNSQTAMAVKKGNTELLDMLNEGLKNIKENQVMDDVEEKWNLIPMNFANEEFFEFRKEIDPFTKEFYGDMTFEEFLKASQEMTFMLDENGGSTQSEFDENGNQIDENGDIIDENPFGLKDYKEKHTDW